ncbi:MAG: TIGR02710 family CRISPR-associated CARF protein, partial [Methanosarcina sp.]|nr:TIGR02710 family CRISPR-associated CARF protein [Methanosarcina sp.]
SKIRQEQPEAEIVVDYTGGTKSMTGGLAAASLDFCGIKLCVVKGDRTDLVKVLDGTERIKVTEKNFAFLNRQFEQARKLMGRYDYEGAISILEETITVSDIPEELDKKIQCLYSFSKAFLAWDRFDHVESWKLLYQKRRSAPENVVFLETVLWSRKKFDEELKNVPVEGLVLSPRGCGYELVEDLVLNAERRASQGRYDDAVGRLYRAFEMLVQMRLFDRYSIDTGNVDLEKLPETLRAEYEVRKKENEKIVFGLRNSYELLSRLNPEDELWKLYAKNSKGLEGALTIRNKSLYAHGMSPISKVQYEEFHERFVNGVLDPFLKTFGKKYALRTQFASADKLLEKL